MANSSLLSNAFLVLVTSGHFLLLCLPALSAVSVVDDFGNENSATAEFSKFHKRRLDEDQMQQLIRMHMKRGAVPFSGGMYGKRDVPLYNIEEERRILAEEQQPKPVVFRSEPGTAAANGKRMAGRTLISGGLYGRR